MRQILVVSTTAAILLSLMAVSSANANNQEEIDINRVVEHEPVGQIKPNYSYPDNSNKDKKEFDKVKQILEQMKVKDGLKLKSIKLVSYSDYINLISNSNSGKIENYQVHPNRQMFLVEIHAPNGYKLPKRRESKIYGITKNNPPLEFKKAILYQVFDAETGNLWSTNVRDVQNLEDY
ncbi:hypothetical protein H6G80_06400 [Nostoc sp. FACHB-87]|uniref:hypothetical protein n=1 Tax=Nostocaceae TaxID=1162 RepID=UPI0016886256|nr:MULTISPECIES: hypothetical protein [Nostocaceae]MBD2300468.1 hypothetical protein [Nostoc sp. FACHB-190]MBD2453705.1 hypothetical protein [Nostoc sp. FACHB-87]MBD2475340.1 hypothetical protein [Anabaena sp. FACHB-83]